MAINKALFNIKGMTRDMAASKFSPEYAFENKNLRIVATDDNTSFGLVNEKGTAATGVTVEGIPIGQEIINDSLILFTTSESGDAVITINVPTGTSITLPDASGTAVIDIVSNFGDHIYKFGLNGNTLDETLLYSGDLGFSAGNPIESISVYEDERIQKVYWTDGINQPRVINIAELNPQWNNNSFNFVKNVTYSGGITVSKNIISFGSFAPGVIQYCFTYYDLYGAETNIFYTTPLYYVSFSNRGAGPEETVSCSFNISIPNYDTRFEYLRIYSILRTSIDATPQVRRVVDISVRDAVGTIVYTDTGTSGEVLDPTDLLFIGGEPILAGTLAQKDNTLFLGDITVLREPINTTTKTLCRSIPVSVTQKTLTLPDNANVGNYSYTSQLNNNNSEITYYRRGEVYRLGLQAQHYTGRWSDVVFIKDYEVTTPIANSGVNMSINNLTGTVSTSIISALAAQGYVKVRPMVVFPDANNRNIICEGVCCPTVYNVEDRWTNSPFSQASWFFRPNAADWSASGALSFNVDFKYGKWAEFRHNYPIPSNQARNAEIQCISNAPIRPLLGLAWGTATESSDDETWVSQNKECYYVDQSIFTFHSPDVEFSSDLSTLESKDSLKFRIVGYVPISASYSDIDIEATAPSNYSKGKNAQGVYEFKPTVAPGFVKTQVTATTDNTQYGWRSLLSGTLWFDDFSESINKNFLLELPVGFVVYPWHKSGALNTGSSTSSVSQLKHKKMSIFRFSKNTKMLGTSSFWTGAVSGITKFDSTEVSMVKLPMQASTSDVTYYGNIDKIVTPHGRPKGTISARDYDAMPLADPSLNSATEDYIKELPGAYPIVIGDNGISVSNTQRHYLSNPDLYDPSSNDFGWELANVRVYGEYNTIFNNEYMYLDLIAINVGTTPSTLQYKRYIYNDTKTTSTDPVSIKYKSTPHLVIGLKQTDGTQLVLPTHSGSCSVNGDSYYSSTNRAFWGNVTAVSQQIVALSDLGNDGYLWLGEVYRDDINPSTRFGGTSDEAIENNSWVPAGEPVDIVDNNNDPVSSDISIVWSQGDTYYQRYDCLKTYPFTMDDINSVSDTLSFMCETRVNIDGRYDRNRGQLSNLYATPTNINLINPAYSQRNNYFSYRGLNSHKVNSSYFPNTITWTKTKTNGEIIDKWTSISLASILNVDGDKGKVRALRRYNNDILSFQDRGISQILYNENVQIATTTGVPIEIANSGKVSGKRYISNHIGCYNKWSICSTPTGIYFMDDIGKDIFLFNGKLNNISDRLGFHSWIVQNFPELKIWNPRDFATGGEITYYDKINGDVMFITGNTCLTFSEPLSHFSSFYSYERTPYFANLEDRSILWHLDDSIGTTLSDSNKYQAWMHREGNYNYFFNVYQPFYTTIVVNEHPLMDKIFNNLEYRGDTFTPGGEYLYSNTFDKLETWNEYQRGIANLNDTTDWGYTTSNLKKKFRIWRAIIPRNTTGGSYRRDRMRNPWLYLKLSKETANSNKTILHDLVVHYFE